MSEVFNVFQQGGVIAYPTEAVFGLGCDPDNPQAIKKLLAIKNRPEEKGLILLAGDFKQLSPYLDISQLSPTQIGLILSRWPNGITQVLPANPNISPLLTGRFKSIAVRITDQPDVVALCSQTNKPIVSTSANFSGKEPVKTWQTLDRKLVEMLDYTLKGETLSFLQPSTIINGLTGEIFRS
jgi:L-threonylcarbamoyladenylate synthase